MWKFANPTVFMGLATRILPWLTGLTVLLFLAGLYGVAIAPDDYQQGATVKIMYIHVPSAWLAMAGCGVMSLSALGVLVCRHPLAAVGHSEGHRRTGREPRRGGEARAVRRDRARCAGSRVEASRRRGLPQRQGSGRVRVGGAGAAGPGEAALRLVL